MRNLTITRRELFSVAVTIATVAAGTLLVLQTDIDLPSAAGAEVEGEMITIPAAPAQITGVTGPEISDEALAAERKFVVPVMRAELRLPEPPAIAVKVNEIRAQAWIWVGDGVVAAPRDEILVHGPDVVRLHGLEEATMEVPQLQRPEPPSPVPVR